MTRPKPIKQNRFPLDGSIRLFIMKSFVVLVLLPALVLLGADAAPDAVACSEDNNVAAQRLAMQAIHDNHDHGYKFKLEKVHESKVNKVQDGCEINLLMGLRETMCSVVNPKNVDDCGVRELGSRAVVANCTVMLEVKNDVSKVTRYECETRQEVTNAEMMSICPDCPVLISLNDPDSLAAVNLAVREYNQNSSLTSVYVLNEVGRILSYYIMGMGMGYSFEFNMVETRCPRGSRIVPEACLPLCPQRANHVQCKSSFNKRSGVRAPECESYPAQDQHVLAPGEMEPVCSHRHRVPFPLPGPPAPPTSQERLPPFQPIQPPPRPDHTHMPCNEPRLQSADNIHPICSWPVGQVLAPDKEMIQQQSM